MKNAKYETITPDMRTRLDANRDGKLTSQQWKSIVTEPLVTLLLLMVPGIMILRGRLFYLTVGGGWLIGLLLIAVLITVMLFRAWRYARAPVQTGVFRAGDQFRPFWMFWKAEIFEDEAGQPARFYKRLAPYQRPQPGERYLIYYLKDGGGNILLSIAPADDPDAARWRPTPAFQTRLVGRGGGG